MAELQELIHRRDWNQKDFFTGLYKKDPETARDLPIYSAKLQNGLHDIEPDGTFVDIDTTIDAVKIGVTSHRVRRGRYGELRFGDSTGNNKHLCKIKYKSGKGVSFKYQGADCDYPVIKDNRPVFVASPGVSIEHTPTYNGIKIDIILDNPETAPAIFKFSIKEYGGKYQYLETSNGGIIMRGDDGADIIIKPPYAIDAVGNIGPVTLTLGQVENGYQTIIKTVDEAWLKSAAGPVRIDPYVLIDDVSGVFIDTMLNSSNPSANLGVTPILMAHKYSPASNENTILTKIIMTSLSGATVLSGYLAATTSARLGNGYNIDIYKIVKGEWIEGTKNNTTATTDEPTWYDFKYGQETWNTGGCRGSGTDRAVAAESSTFVGSTGLHTFNLTAPTLQDHIDNPSSNYGFVWDTEDAAPGEYEQFFSSESGVGDLPFLYVTFIENIIGHHGMDGGFRQLAGGINQ